MSFIIYEWTVNFIFINTGQEFAIKIFVADQNNIRYLLQHLDLVMVEVKVLE
jgi:hypothetical protein